MLTKSNQGSVDSLYAEYVQEIAGETIESGQNWFFSYKIKGPTLHISELYIRKASRRTLLVGCVYKKVMAMMIGSGCSRIEAVVQHNNPYAGSVIALYSGIGFRIIDADRGQIRILFEHR